MVRLTKDKIKVNVTIGEKLNELLDKRFRIKVA